MRIGVSNSGACGTSKLSGKLHDLSETRRSDGMAAAEKTPSRIDR